MKFLGKSVQSPWQNVEANERLIPGAVDVAASGLWAAVMVVVAQSRHSQKFQPLSRTIATIQHILYYVLRSSSLGRGSQSLILDVLFRARFGLAQHTMM
jgi:hypothetical protein